MLKFKRSVDCQSCNVASSSKVEEVYELKVEKLNHTTQFMLQGCFGHIVIVY